MKHKDLIESLQIFDRYESGGSIRAEHDTIYAGDDEVFEAMSSQDKERLEELGWEWDEDSSFWYSYV